MLIRGTEAATAVDHRGRYGVLRRAPLIGVLLLLASCAQVTNDTRKDSIGQSNQSAVLQLAAADNDDYEDLDAAFGIGRPAHDDNGDPLETLNRFTFAFNDAVDTVIIRPAAVTYRDLVPTFVQDAVRTFLRTLSAPIIFANDLLQGETERASDTAARFFINVTLGLGMFDVAAEEGIQHHNEDFGQTLAVWGADEGFYLVLPVLGPSNLRDATGRVVDSLLDPVSYIARSQGIEYSGAMRGAAEGIDQRARLIDTLDEVRADSIDYYARIRSLYRQIREQQIRNESGWPQETLAEPDLAPLQAAGLRDPL